MIFCLASVPLNHRIIELFGLEGFLKSSNCNPPAMGKDTFHQEVILFYPQKLYSTEVITKMSSYRTSCTAWGLHQQNKIIVVATYQANCI